MKLVKNNPEIPISVETILEKGTQILKEMNDAYDEMVKLIPDGKALINRREWDLNYQSSDQPYAHYRTYCERRFDGQEITAHVPGPEIDTGRVVTWLELDKDGIMTIPEFNNVLCILRRWQDVTTNIRNFINAHKKATTEVLDLAKKILAK